MRALACLAVAAGLSLAIIAHSSATKSALLKIGGRSPVQPGDPTAYPHRITPKSKFYVLVVAKGIPPMCTFEDCGPEGALVERHGGWITGDDQLETIALAGLDEVEVKAGRQSIVVVSDARGRIVGIYPNHSTADLPRILRIHGFLSDQTR
jgi:hypothetical protein